MTSPSLFAVHLSDGVLRPDAAGLAWMLGGFAVAAALVAVAGWKVPPDDVPKIGLLSAAFFVASQIHFPVGIGSAHLILNGLLGFVLGKRAPLAVAVGITLQSFLFDHGGKTMIGVNTVVVALPALAAAALFPLLRRRLNRPGLLGGVLGTGTALASVALSALVLAFMGREEYYALAGVVVLTNVPFAIAEGVATGAIVAYLTKVKPEWVGNEATTQSERRGVSSPVNPQALADSPAG
jgi:cobalt/nickel transport system permease protein